MPTRPPIHQHSRPTRAVNQQIRNVKNSQVYNGAWRRFRNAYIKFNPLCVMCKAEGRITEATEVDHIIPIKKGGAILDTTNLQSLCGPHHSAKTARENTGESEA